ncbi:MAG: hypothetical protein P9E24_05575 [Candidatus Competibacter sp.]|nr:hypothetical protein [Candidatus Competibacter sp.]MDG4585593.1 hypothetical protein [Candidatus Competibacter sp.]
MPFSSWSAVRERGNTLSDNTVSSLSARLWRKGLLPCHDIGPRERAPKLALVADSREAELNGVFVLSRLAAFLRGIEAGERRGLRLRERIVIVPAIEGPTRSGGRRGPSVPRVATEAMVKLTQAAYYRVNIRPASPEMEDMPQVCLYAPNDDERASACLFGLPAVIERPVEDSAPSELMRAWQSCGGENFVMHAGQAGGLQTSHCETLFRALVAFLDRTGIVGGLRPSNEDEDLHYFGLEQICVVLAEQSGIFASELSVGRWVRAGEALGHIHDGFSGDIRARVVTPVAGLLASVRRQPLLCAGGLVAQVLTPDNAIQRGLARRRLGERHERQVRRGL